MTKRIIICACFFITACASLPQSRWQLAYHHDANGNPIEGSKTALIEAAVNGHPVRVVLPIREDFLHAMDAGFFNRDERGAVCANSCHHQTNT